MRNKFFLRMLMEHPQVAGKELLGHLLVRRFENGELAVGRIIEVEAYHEEEPASHSFRGKTARNAPMFLPAGHLYVYFIYGNHYCVNISCMEEGVGAALLIRALEPICPQNLRLGGPGLICRELDIDKSFNGVDALDRGSQVFLARGFRKRGEKVVASPRIGIKKAREYLWRFRLVEGRAGNREES